MERLSYLLLVFLICAASHGSIVLQIDGTAKTLRISGEMTVQLAYPTNYEHYKAVFDNPVGPLALDTNGESDWQLFEGEKSPYNGLIPFTTNKYLFNSETTNGDGYLLISATPPPGQQEYAFHSYYPGVNFEFWFIGYSPLPPSTHTYIGSEIEFSYTNDWLWQNPVTQLYESLTPTTEMINLIEGGFFLNLGSTESSLQSTINVEAIPEPRFYAMALGLLMLAPALFYRK